MLSRACNVPRSLAGALTLSIKSHAGRNKSRGERAAKAWREGGNAGGGNPKSGRGHRALAFIL